MAVQSLIPEGRMIPPGAANSVVMTAMVRVWYSPSDATLLGVANLPVATMWLA